MRSRPLLLVCLAVIVVVAACAASAPVETAQSQATSQPPTPATTRGIEAAPSPSPAQPAPAAPTARPSPTRTPAPPLPLPAPIAPQTLAWQPCGRAQCAKLDVPLDHEDLTGDTLGLAVIRIPASGEPLGSLVVNPGGPGASGLKFLPAFADSVPESIRARFDLVSWDPRGVGASSGLVCNADPAEELNVVPDTRDGIRSELDEAIHSTVELGAACLASEPDLLQHVGTRASARDLDLLRAALGESHLRYLGYSYGTRLGAVYATLFPQAVEAMVLDGAFPPGLSSTELALKAADLEHVLERIDHVCDLEVSCRVADPGLMATFNELLSSSNQTVRVSPLGISDRAALIGATLLAIYVPSAWEQFADALYLASNRDYSGLHVLAQRWYGDGAGNFDSIFRGANTAIMCADGAYAATSAATAVDAEAALQASPVLGESLFGATCAGWPVAAEPLPQTNTVGAPTLLVIGGRYDPATPLRWAERLSSDLHAASLVRYTGDGHTVFARGNACVDDVVARYLLEGVTPPHGTSCEPASGTLGIRVGPHADGLAIIEVADTSPVANQLTVGDVITARDGQSTAGHQLLQTVADEQLQLTIRSGSDAFVITTTSARRPWHHPAD